ncbi:MAG TPA: hypothetical protein IAA57_10915 [Candidatus Pullilachnospira intestinigallinarum]|nr:hypothetical protein [Candidatus Pullilachnospira intestinigallinarum]
MNRNRKPMGRKKCLKMMGVLLASAMVTAGTGSQAAYASGQDSHIEKTDKEEKETTVIYLNGESGSDRNSGATEKKAVRTFGRAAELVGEEGRILICGTVTVDGEETWELPDGVSVRAADDFSDPLVCVNGSLTLENVWMEESRIEGDGEVTGAVRESLVTVPEVITIDQPVPLAEISLAECEGRGTFSWEKKEEVPSAWETVYQVIFRPEDPDAEDYSREDGWDAASGTVIRQVTVQVLSLKDAGEDEVVSEIPEEGENGADGSETDAETDTPDTGDSQGSDESGAAEEMPAESVQEQDPEAETDGAEENTSPENGETGADQQPGSEEDTVQEPDAETSNQDQPSDNGQSAEDGPSGEAAADGDGTFDGQEVPAGENSDSEDPEEIGQQPGTGTEETPGEQPEVPTGESGTEADGAETPDAGVQQPGGDTGSEEDQTADADDLQENMGSDAGDRQQAANVQAQLDALPGQVTSFDEVNLVVEATRAYLRLSDAQRELLNSDSVKSLENLQQQAAVLNRTSGEVSIEGDFPWYVQFQAIPYSQQEQLQLPGSAGVDTVIAPYDMRLWDLMNQQEYHLKGQQVRITMPAPDMSMFSQLVVLHYLEDGSVEYITPVNNGDGTISFLTTSFSPYNLAGSQVLVGNTNWLYTPAVVGGASPSASTAGTQTGQSSSSSGRGGATGKGTQTLTGNTSPATQSQSTGTQKTSSRVNRVVATNDPQNPLLYVGVGAAALIILAGAAVGVKKSAGSRKKTEDIKE